MKALNRKRRQAKRKVARMTVSQKGISPAPVQKVIDCLKVEYPESRCSLDFSTVWELLVATILSAQSTDSVVNTVTPELFKKFPDLNAFANSPVEMVEESTRRVGLGKRKAGTIVNAAKVIREQHGGEVPATMKELLSIPGVGRKTANVVLGVGMGLRTGVVVDTHVARISQLLGWTQEERPDRIERDLREILPESEWISISHLLIDLGRSTCTAKELKCSQCPLNDMCPSRQNSL